MKILIAEDHLASHHVLRTRLVASGYEVASAYDGQEALDILAQLDAPKFAILDWKMPKKSGVDVCRAVRADRQQPYRYLILLTAYSESDQIVEGLEAGADDYLCKPFQGAELHARIRGGERILQLQSELVAATEQLRREATVDELTGLFNRAATLRNLERCYRTATDEGGPLSTILLDVDRFKSINDTHGHDAGDEVLRELAKRLHVRLRPKDTIGRYGGEEFLVVLPGCDVLDAARVAERLRASVESVPIILPNGVSLRVTASFGVSELRSARSVPALITYADRALYRAKELGRNRVEVTTQL
jgi:two-component system, cell cycle response regulator